MTRELRLYEELMLLALKEEKGTILVEFVEYAMSAAILSELIIEKRIVIDDSKKQFVQIRDSESVHDPIIDEAFDLIRSSKKVRRLQDWTTRIASIKELRHKIAKQLVDKNILIADTDKILLLFTRRIYPELNPIPEQEIRRQMEHAIFNESDNLDERLTILIALADSINLLPKIFDKKEVKRYKDRIKAIVNGERTSKAAKETIEAIQTAIIIASILPAIIASTTVTTS